MQARLVLSEDGWLRWYVASASIRRGCGAGAADSFWYDRKVKILSKFVENQASVRALKGIKIAMLLLRLILIPLSAASVNCSGAERFGVGAALDSADCHQRLTLALGLQLWFAGRLLTDTNRRYSTWQSEFVLPWIRVWHLYPSGARRTVAANGGADRPARRSGGALLWREIEKYQGFFT